LQPRVRIRDLIPKLGLPQPGQHGATAHRIAVLERAGAAVRAADHGHLVHHAAHPEGDIHRGVGLDRAAVARLARARRRPDDGDGHGQGCWGRRLVSRACHHRAEHTGHDPANRFHGLSFKARSRSKNACR
jgi:hypothetical protein